MYLINNNKNDWSAACLCRAVSYLDRAVLLIKWPGNPVTWHGQLVPCGQLSRFCEPLRCYCADSLLCSQIDLQVVVPVVRRRRTPATVSSCSVQPAIVRVSVVLVVARGGHAAVRDPTRVLNADWPTRAWNRPRREYYTCCFCIWVRITDK